MFELAERIRALTGLSSEIVLVPYDEAYEQGFEDMPRRVPDIKRIEALLGWWPTVPLETIIAGVLEHQRTADVY